MRFYLDSVGCRLNQAEIEGYARQLRKAGHSIVENLEAADAAILNTCAVTGQAVADSRQKARRMGKMDGRQVILTGCWSTLVPQEAGALPGVVSLVPNIEKDNLVTAFLENIQNHQEIQNISLAPESAPPMRMLPGRRQRTRAFIKVQEGCNNRCSFCITALARGPARSRPLEGVLADITDALQNGTQEIVLSGVNLGSWQTESNQNSRPSRLSDLIQTILKETSVPRLRLSSVEPWDLDDDFFDLWQDGRLCRHLHIPLQSGCAPTLWRMARRTTPESYARLLDVIREVAPEMAVTTDVMVGFPGETEEEFQASLDFVRSMNFAGGHVFAYSERPGTAAAQMTQSVPHAIRKQRSRLMRAVLDETAHAYRNHFIGTNQGVLWESVKEDAISRIPDGRPTWTMEGLTDNYLRVRVTSPEPLWNHISAVHLLSLEEDVILGEII